MHRIVIHHIRYSFEEATSYTGLVISIDVSNGQLCRKIRSELNWLTGYSNCEHSPSQTSKRSLVGVIAVTDHRMTCVDLASQESS